MRAARAGLRNAVAFRPALIAKGRTWALLAATYLGYDWFERVREAEARGVSRRAASRRPEASSRSGGITVNR